MDSIDSKLYETIKRAYTSLEVPNFSFIEKALDANPYIEVITSLQQKFSVEDKTDINYDISFSLLIDSNNESWLLQLSMVGRYAALFRLTKSGDIETTVTNCHSENYYENEILNLLVLSDIELLSQQTMAKSINFKRIDSCQSRFNLYQVLFVDTEVMPWDAM